jgi:hypothetical protein
MSVLRIRILRNKVSKEQVFKISTIVFLFVTIASGLLPGIITKSALVLSILINLIYFPNKTKVITILCFSSYILLTVLIDSIDGVSESTFIVLLLLVWFISIPKFYNGYLECIKTVVIYSLILGAVAAIYSIFFPSQNYDFTYNMASKGLPNIEAFIGLSNIPQTYGILGIMVYVLTFEHTKKRSYLYLFIANLALNRVTFILTLVSIFKRYLLLALLFFISLLLVLIFTIDSETLFATHSLTNRVGLTLGIWQQYMSGSLLDILIGIKSKPQVFYMTSIVGIDYIENGYMFLLYYYGVIGLFSYLLFFSFWIFIIPFLFKVKLGKLNLYIAILYFFIVPLFTHEMLHINFYMMMYILFYRTYSSKLDRVVGFPLKK